MISFNKITSVIVAACFVLTSIGGQAAASVAENMRATEQYKQIFSDFMLPYSYGKITDAHFASTDRVIINIQDLHCHPKVQKNISNIIDLFNKRYGVKTVYLEGAYGDVDTSWISKTVDSNYKNKLLDKMIETGRLTGAEYYSALSGKTNIIKGLETKEPYLENLKRFGEIIENKEKISVILESVEKSGNELRTKYYDRRQLKIEELSKQYEFGKITAEKYYILLAKHIDRLGIDITGYGNTLNYMTLMEMQKNLKYGEITNQLQTLVLALKGTLPAGAYKMLLDSTGNLSQIDKLYGCLIKITRQYNLDMSVNYPELDKYFAYIELSQKINPLGLLEENKKLTEEINSRFSNTKAQSEVVFLVNFERYLKDYLTSKITSADYEYYKNNVETYKKLWAKYADNKVLSLLDVYMAQTDKFYEINTARNGYFTENIFNEVVISTITPSVQSGNETAKIIENMPQTKRVDIIITGGFHTGTVSEILKNNNVSYMVITPNVTDGLKTAEETYYKIAKEQSKISFQTLANLIASLSPVEQKRVLIAADPSLESKLGFIPDTQESILSQEQIKQLAETVKMSEVLLSDDKGEIKQQIIQNIKDRLESSDPELAKETDEELIKYVDMDKLKTAFENTQELKRLIEHAVKIKTAADASVTGQSLSAMEELAAKIIEMIGLLQKISTASEKTAETPAAQIIQTNEEKKDAAITAAPDEKQEEIIQEQSAAATSSDVQKEKTSKQKKSGKISGITKKILPFILAITILFTGFLNIGRYGSQPSAAAETQTVAVSQPVSPAVTDTQLYANNRFLFNYLRNNQSLFAPSDIAFLNGSVELSNGSEAKELVKQIYKTLGITAEAGSVPEILFVTGSNAPLYSACACSDINVIIIPVGADLKLPSAGEMAGKVAHENTHIKNHQKVISGEMSQLEDETMATEAGIVADETYEKNLVIESMFNGTASVNDVTAMPLFGFYSILENQETVVKKFIEITGDKNITFNDIYYSGVFFGSQNKAQLPAEVKLDSLGENEVAIRLYYGNTSIMYVVKVDGSSYSLSKIEVFSDNLYVQADKKQISEKISLYYSPNPVFGAEDVIESLNIVSVSEALLKSKDINLETLQFISFYFPYEREDDGDSDIIRFVVRNENGIFYGIDVKKDVGIIKISNNGTGEEVWKAKEGLSKDIIAAESSQQSGQRTGTLGTSVTIESSRPEKSDYSKIYKLSVNKLKAFVQNENNGISERFLAFLILKNKGINIQIPEEMLAAGKQYLRDIESGKSAIITAEEIENNKYKTADDRLKSALAAVYYIMLNSYINEFNIEQTVLDKIWKDIYEKAKVAFSNSGGADSNLSFQPDSLTSDIMAHELLHNITDVYLGAEKNLTSSAFAEFSSDIAKIVLCQQLGIDIPSDLKDRYKEYAAYIKAGAIPLEEHYLARGIIGLIMEVSADAGRNINWNNMMSAVSQCLQNADFVNLINSNNFNKVFALVLEKYIEIETDRPVENIEVLTEQTSELYDNIVKLFTPQLTMTWLSKLLDFLKIKDFEKRQKWINAIENPIIIIGWMFPVVQRWFIRRHKGQSEELVKVGINTILKQAGLTAVNSISIIRIIIMLTNASIRMAMNNAHTNWNLLQVLVPVADINNQKIVSFLTDVKNNGSILKIIAATKGLPDAVLQYVLEEVSEDEKFDYDKFIEVVKKIKRYDAETLDFVSLYLISDKTSDEFIFEFFALNEESKSLIIEYGINRYNKDWEEDNLILAINILKGYENFEYSETEIKFLLKLIFTSSAQNITRLNKKPNKRILNTVLNNIQLLYTSNRPYVDGGLILGLIFCDFNMSQNDVNRMASLIEQLAVRKITGLAIENDALAIKIFLNSFFQDSLNDKGITDIVMQYKIAIKLSRSIYSNIGENAVNLSEYRLERMIEAALESHYRIAEIAGNADVLSDEIGVFGFYNNEELKNGEGRRFTPKGISKIIELLEINPKRQIHLEIEAGQNPKKKAKEFLSYIRNFGSIKKQYGVKKGFFILEGHGSSEGFYYDEDNFISVEDITNALEEANNSGVDLEEITIDLSCCHSYYFANNIIRSLKRKNIEKYPQILTDAGYETVYAYDDYIGIDETQPVSNLYFGIIGYLQNKKIIGQSVKGRLSLRNIFELDLYLSDHTVFITNDDIKEENDRLKEKLQKILEEKDFPDIKTEEFDAGTVRFNPAIINAGFIKAIPNVQFDAIQELKFVMEAQKNINIDLLNAAFENNLKKFNLINFVKERISGIVNNIIKKVEKVKEYMDKLNNKIADIAKTFNVFSHVFKPKNEYQNLLQIRSPVLDSRMSELTMMWLSKKLDKKGITGQKRDDIINRKENIWIVLGVIFPNSIGRIFAYLHLTKEEKGDKTAKETKINSVREAMKTVAGQVGLTVPTGNFIKKLITGIIFYRSNKDLLSLAHTAWNRTVKIPDWQSKAARQDISDEEKERLAISLEEHKKILALTYGDNPYAQWDAEIRSILVILLDAMISIGKITAEEKKEYELNFFYSDNFDAYAFRNSKSVFISTGVLLEFQKYFGANFSRDHIAAVLAHELQHTMQSNKKNKSGFERHGEDKRKEYNSDIEALDIMDFAGFNPRASSEVMKSFVSSDRIGKLIGLAYDPHPDSEDRLKAINRILQDKNVFFINISKEYQRYNNADEIKSRDDAAIDEIKQNIKTVADLKNTGILGKYKKNIYDLLILLKYLDIPDIKDKWDEIKRLILEEIVERDYAGFNKQQQALICEILVEPFAQSYNYNKQIQQITDAMSQKELLALKNLFESFNMPVGLSFSKEKQDDFGYVVKNIGSVYFSLFFLILKKLNYPYSKKDYNRLFAIYDIRSGINKFVYSLPFEEIYVFLDSEFSKLGSNIQAAVIEAIEDRLKRFTPSKYSFYGSDNLEADFEYVNKTIETLDRFQQYSVLRISYDLEPMIPELFNLLYIKNKNNPDSYLSGLSSYFRVFDMLLYNDKANEKLFSDILTNLKQSGVSFKEIMKAAIVPESAELIFKTYGDEINNLSVRQVKEIIDILVEHKKFYNSREIWGYDDSINNNLYKLIMLYLCKKNNIDFDYTTGSNIGSLRGISYESLVDLDDEYGYADNKKNVVQETFSVSEVLHNIIPAIILETDFDNDKLLRFSRYLTAGFTGKPIPVPDTDTIYMSDDGISETPVEILNLFREFSNRSSDFFKKGEEITVSYGRYIELKTWQTVKKETGFLKRLNQILNHFHGVYELQDLQNREIKNLWISFLCDTAGLSSVEKSTRFAVNFKNGKQQENFEYKWYELNNGIFKKKLTGGQISYILEHYDMIKKYLSQEQQIQYGRLIYELIKRNKELSVFKDINEHIKLMNFLFEEASPVKDEVIYDIFSGYDIDIDTNNYLVSLLTSKAHDDEKSDDANNRIMEMEILNSMLKNMSKHDKSEVLAWLLSDDAKRPECFKKIILKYHPDGKYILNFNNLRNSFRMLSSVERFEFIDKLFELNFDVERNFSFLKKQLKPDYAVKDIFAEQYIPQLLADIKNPNITISDKKMKISVFYEIFVLPAVSGTEKEQALNERQKIMDLILKGDTAECEKIINERKKTTINLTAKEIKTLMTAYLSVNTNMINLKDLYMFFNLMPLADNLEKSFAEYIDALDRTILASASLGSVQFNNKINKITQFYKYFVFPVYGENAETIKERDKIIARLQKIYDSAIPFEERYKNEQLFQKDWKKISAAYKRSGKYTVTVLKNLLRTPLSFKELSEGSDMSIYDAADEMFVFLQPDSVEIVNNILDYENTIGTVCEVLFGEMGKLSHTMSRLFKIILLNSNDDQRVVFVNELIGKMAEIAKTNDGSKYADASRLGKIIAVMGANSGVGVIKLLQMFANGKTFLKLGKTEEEGQIINEEISKVQSSNDPLYKSTMFAILRKAGVLRDGVIIGKLLGSASIAQTHIVTLKDGKKVVAKFKRPSIAKNLDADFKILEELLKYFKSNFPDMAWPEARQVNDMINEELDFTIEMNAAIKISNNAKKRKSKIRIPKIYTVVNGNLEEATQDVRQSAAENVFFQEYIDGEPLSKKNKNQKSRIYFDILQEFFEEVFEDGFFHADLHEGNIMIDRQGRIVFIDFGGCGQIRGKDEVEKAEKKQALKDMFLSAYNGKYEEFERALMTYNPEIYEKIKNKGKLKELQEIITDKGKIEKKFTDLFILLNTLDEQGMDKDFLMFFQSLSKIGKYVDNLSGPYKLRIFSYLNKGKTPSTLQNKTTVEKLNKIGNGKFIKWLYENNINKTGENFRYTNFGVAIGVIVETFSLWTPNFIKSHDNPTMGMKITVWVIRALSIGIGVTVALSPVSPLLIAPAVILAEWIAHFIWNKVQISNNDFLSDDTTSAVTEKQVNFYKKLKNKPLEEVISKINMRDGLNTDENDEHFIRMKKKTARLLKAYIERQFKKKEKGITELISNALDAGEDNIDVSVGKGRITVENDGKEGISLKTVFDNLLNITNSTKTERRVQIGRFGLGFFSSLNYLENEDDELSIVSLRSDTCFRVTIGIKYEDGIKKYYIKDVESLTRQEAGRFARHLKGNGTSISMKIKALEKQEEADNIIKGIKYDFSHSLKKIKLYHGGGYDVLGYNENSFKKLEREPDTEAGLLFNPQKALPGAGRIIVVIKGVKFFELKVLGSNISKEMIVDLPNSLNFSISRDSITVDSELEINIAELVNNIAYGSLPFKDKIMLLNSLYPLCQHFEIQKTGFVNAVEIKKITRELIKREIELAEKEGRTLFVCRDTVENYEFFGADNPEVVFVNMNLMPKELYYTNNVKITVIRNPLYPAEKTRLIIRHFVNNTDYSSAGEKGEFAKKELIGIGEDNEIIFINSGKRGFFEKNKYIIPYSMNPVIQEIQDGKYRTRMHESAKFPGQEYWYGSMEDLFEEVNGGKKDESEFEERYEKTEYLDIGYFGEKEITRGTVADLMIDRYSIARSKAAMIQNELRQTIHDLSQTGGMFVTELIQNAYESGASSLEIKFDEKQGVFVISDNGNGMSYDTIINELLLPNSSSKEGLNVFGTGIFSVFRENVRRVSVMTSAEEGTYVIELMPVYDDNGFVVNVEYVIYSLETARPKGTTVTVFGNGASSLFKNKYIFNAVARQAGLISKDNVEIVINGEKFNDFMDEKIFAKPVGEDSDFSIYNIGGGKSFLSVNNRFVRELDFNFLFELGINKDHLLFEALKYLIDSGIVLKFPDNTEILFNKQDVKMSDRQKKQIIDYLFASFVQLYMHDAGGSNSTIIPEIPYDYLKNGGPDTPFLKKLNRFQITSKGYNVETVMAFLKAFSFDFAGSAEFIKAGNVTALQDFIIEMCMFAGESEESAEEKSWEMIAEIIADMNDGKTEDIIDVMKNFRGEILNRVLRIIMTEEEIKTYEIEKIGAAIMKSNDISVQSRFKYDGYCRGITAGHFINSLMGLSNKEAQTDRNDKIGAPSAVDNKTKQPKQNKEDVTINGKPLSSLPELSYMYDVIRALLDALIEAYGYDNNINLDFVFDLSNNAIAYAEGNTIAMNIAALRDLVTSLKDSNHDLFSETLALLFHEFTHIVENEEDGTHNKIFYDLERKIMYKFLTDVAALEKLEKTIDGVERNHTVQRKLFESFRNVVIQIWGRTAYAEYLKKNPDVLKEEQGLKDSIKDYIEAPVAAVSFADYKRQAAAKLSRNAAEDGNENLKAGKQMTSVRILNAIGNMKFIKWLYGNKAEKTGENFRYTVLGVAIGVILETFVLWRSDFINLHENPTFEMKVGVWLIRGITIILGVTSAFSSPISPLVAIPVFIMTEWISHFIWNRSQISNQTPENMLQTTISGHKLMKMLLGEIFKDWMFHANIFEKNKIMQMTLLALSALAMNNDIELPSEVYRAIGNAFNGVFSKQDHEIIHRYVNDQKEEERIAKLEQQSLMLLEKVKDKISYRIELLLDKKRQLENKKAAEIREIRDIGDVLRKEMKDREKKKDITAEERKDIAEIEDLYAKKFNDIQQRKKILEDKIKRANKTIEVIKALIRKLRKEQYNRELIIKNFTDLYAYRTYENFVNDPENQKYVDEDGSIKLPYGYKLTLEQWRHICDGHSVFTNGNEIEGADRYPSSETALENVITLDFIVNNIGNILKNPDVFAKRKTKKSSMLYIKRLVEQKEGGKETHKVCVLVVNENHEIITCYIIDTDKYEANPVYNIFREISGELVDKYAKKAKRNQIYRDIKDDKYEIEIWHNGDTIRGSTSDYDRTYILQKVRFLGNTGVIRYDDPRIVSGLSASKKEIEFSVMKKLAGDYRVYTQSGGIKVMLQNKSTVEKLNKIGNGKFIKWLYGNNINSTGENFRYTVLGVAIGVILETFALWTPNFIKSHDNPTIGMKITVWIIRALSIGIGVTVAFSPVSPLLIASAVILAEWITHFIWNKVQISKDNKNNLLQSGSSQAVKDDYFNNIAEKINFQDLLIDWEKAIPFIGDACKIYLVDNIKKLPALLQNLKLMQLNSKKLTLLLYGKSKEPILRSIYNPSLPLTAADIEITFDDLKAYSETGTISIDWKNRQVKNAVKRIEDKQQRKLSASEINEVVSLINRAKKEMISFVTGEMPFYIKFSALYGVEVDSDDLIALYETGDFPVDENNAQIKKAAKAVQEKEGRTLTDAEINDLIKLIKQAKHEVLTTYTERFGFMARLYAFKTYEEAKRKAINGKLSLETWVHICEGHMVGFNQHRSPKGEEYYSEDENSYDYAVTPDDLEYTEIVYSDPDAVIILDKRDNFNNKQVLYVKYINGNIYICDILENGAIKSLYKLSKAKYLQSNGELNYQAVKEEYGKKGKILVKGKDYISDKDLRGEIKTYSSNVSEEFTAKQNKIEKSGVVLLEKINGVWTAVNSDAQIMMGIENNGVFFKYADEYYFYNSGIGVVLKIEIGGLYELEFDGIKSYAEGKGSEIYYRFKINGEVFLLSERGNVSRESDKKILEGTQTLVFMNSVIGPVFKNFDSGRRLQITGKASRSYWYELLMRNGSPFAVLNLTLNGIKRIGFKIYKTESGWHKSVFKDDDQLELFNYDKNYGNSYVLVRIKPAGRIGWIEIKIDPVTGKILTGMSADDLLAQEGILLFVNSHDFEISLKAAQDFKKKPEIEIKQIKIPQKQTKYKKFTALNAAERAVSVINPVKVLTKASLKIVAAADLSYELEKEIEENKIGYDIKTNLVITDTAAQASALRNDGLNAVNARTALSKEMKGKKGLIIGEYKGVSIRVYMDAVSRELIFYSNDPVFNMGTISREDLKEMFMQSMLSGMNNKMFKGINRIIIAENAAGLDVIVNGIKNAVTDGLSKPPVSINLDFSGRKDVSSANIEKITKGETNNGLDSNTVIFNPGQLSAMKETELLALQEKGYEVIVVTSNISEAEEIIKRLHINGAVIKISGAVSEQELIKIKHIADSNMQGRKIIKTQMFVEGLSDETLTSFGDIYEKYSIIPVVAVNSAYPESNKKCSVRITESDINASGIFEKSGVISVIADKVSTVKKSAGGITDAIRDILKPATPKQKFITELRNVRASGYYFAATDIKKALADKNGILFRLAAGGEWFEGEDEKANEEKLKEALDILLSENILNGFAKNRVEHLVKKGKYYEALGCVRGIVEKNVETVILSKLKTGGIEITGDKLKKYAGGVLRDALIITGIRLLAEGKDIEPLLEDGFINSDMTAQQYFDSIIARLNGQMKDIVKQNEYEINVIKDEKEAAQAIADFKDFNLLMQDQLREKSAVKTAGISSSFAVRSILGAA